MSAIDDLFGGVKSLIGQAGQLAPTAAAWKELIDPVRAVQQPTLGTGAGTPIIQPPPSGTISKTPGSTSVSNTTLWIAIGAVAIVLLFLITGRK